MDKHREMVFRAARNMIERYGDDALVEVDLRIAELTARGQHDTETLWKEIREAVRFLTYKPDDYTEQ